MSGHIVVGEPGFPSCVTIVKASPTPPMNAPFYHVVGYACIPLDIEAAGMMRVIFWSERVWSYGLRLIRIRARIIVSTKSDEQIKSVYAPS